MTAGFAWRTMMAESRGSRGRLLFLVACLAVGVAAVTGVAGLVRAVDAGVGERSREILAADLEVAGRRALPGELAAILPVGAGVERTDVREMATMVAGPSGDDSRIAQLRVVDGRWPLYGTLLTEPAGLGTLDLGPDRVLAAGELLDGLGIGVGDTLRLGGAEFVVAGRILEEPGRLDFSVLLGPRVMLTAAGLERTALLGFGNRVRYRALFRFEPEPGIRELERIAEDLRDRLPGAAYLDVDTHRDAQPGLQRAMARVESYLALVALLSLVLGGVGVAQIVRTWIESRTQAVAVLRCLGLRPREILVLFLGHVTLLALVACAVGGAVGLALPWVVPHFAPDLIPPDLVHPWQPAALLRGTGLGLGIALLAALPPLTAVWRVSPARVLRHEAEPLPAPRWVGIGTLVLLAAGLFAAAWLQSGRLDRAAGFTLGLAATGALLALGARLVMRFASRAPRTGLHPALLHGLAALGRPGAGVTGAVVALGLGVTTVIGMYLVETRLESGLRESIPADAPTVFLIDIQPDQWEGVAAVLADGAAERVDRVPVTMARLAEVDGRAVEDLAREREDDDRRARWVLTREQRLTTRATLPADNTIVDGALWSDPERDEVSIEQGFAEDLGVGVGSTLLIDVQGVPIPLTVTSIRTVEWQSFSINFFLIVEPGVLDRAPGLVLANARVPEAREVGVQDRLAREFPNVTMLRVRPIIEQVLGLMRRIGFGVRLLGGFTVLAGIAILAGAVSATALRRGREAALLKTLGATRGGVVALFAVEYGLLGAVAGGLGAVGGLGLAWGFLDRVVQLPVDLPAGVLAAGVLGGAALTTVFGLLASARAITVRPIESLRSAD